MRGWAALLREQVGGSAQKQWASQQQLHGDASPRDDRESWPVPGSRVPEQRKPVYERSVSHLTTGILGNELRTELYGCAFSKLTVLPSASSRFL